MERQPKYIGTPKDLSERMIHEFLPGIKENMRKGKVDEVSGIIALQAQMVREIIPQKEKACENI